MPHGSGRWALLLIFACCIAGCEGGASNSARLDARTSVADTAVFASPGEALQRAERLRLAGADVEALAILAAAHRRYPNHAHVLSAYGRLALAMGHDELAARLLQSAVGADPRDWRALSAQGVLEWRNGRPSDARGALIKARTISAGDSAVLNNLAVGYLLENRPAEAVSLLRQALAAPQLNPAHGRKIRRNLAVALAVEGNFAEADRLVQVALPRSLEGADASAIRQFMGLGGAAPAARQAGWEARLTEGR